MKIHISETTKKELENYPYEVEERGSIQVKGKGEMKTYWLVGKKDIPESDMPQCPFLAIMQEEVRSRKAEEIGEDSQGNNEMGSQTALHSYSPVSFKDMRMEAPSPLGNIGNVSSGASAAAGLLRLDNTGVHSSPRARSVSIGKCPFSSGTQGSAKASPSNSHLKISNEVLGAQSIGQTNGLSKFVPMSSSHGIKTPLNDDNARPGLKSLDSGISVSGPSCQQDLKDDLLNQPHSVGNPRFPTSTSSDPTGFIPSVAKSQNLDHSPAKHPTTQECNIDVSSRDEAPELGANVKAGEGFKAKTSQPLSADTTSFNTFSKPQNSSAKSSGMSNNNNDNIYHAQDVKGQENQNDKGLIANGNIDVDVKTHNNILSEPEYSKNGTHAFKNDVVYAGDAKGTGKSTERKSKMCNIF
ncbi:soluble guanylate cyclase 88e-like [Plakobranchus ocellatus]|uniref:Soluble guanylate cyclase 88e-like n=1 Tax=Plakobranchus ocellatus TaxID=259542 RepID=A0AAV4A3P2_9GAST|nr:soluble guanylate cyclase 88e-like [Plakobranchus ocellatus]